MVNVSFPLMFLLIGCAQLGRLLGWSKNRPALKWLFVAMNLAALLPAVAVLAGYPLFAPVPSVLLPIAGVASLVMCCAAVYLQSKQPLSGGS